MESLIQMVHRANIYVSFNMLAFLQYNKYTEGGRISQSTNSWFVLPVGIGKCVRTAYGTLKRFFKDLKYFLSKLESIETAAVAHSVRSFASHAEGWVFEFQPRQT